MDGDIPGGQSTNGFGLTVARYLALYALWIGICAIGFWLIFLIRTNLVEDIFFLRVNPWQLRAVDRWSVYVLGAVWIVGVFLVEGYLRRALERGRLLVSAGKILLIETVLVALSFLLHSL